MPKVVPLHHVGWLWTPVVVTGPMVATRMHRIYQGSFPPRRLQSNGSRW